MFESVSVLELPWSFQRKLNHLVHLNTVCNIFCVVSLHLLIFYICFSTPQLPSVVLHPPEQIFAYVWSPTLNFAYSVTLWCVFFPYVTKQFSSPHQTLTGYPINLSQFRYCLPGDSIRLHRLRAQVQDCPHSRCQHKSRISPVLLPNWLQIWGFHDPLLRFDQIATVVHRTQKASFLFCLVLFFFFFL